MRLFGHHVASPALMLSIIDGLLFLIALYALGFTGKGCEGCYFQSATNLSPYEGVLLAFTFVLISASIGLYNRDALLEFPVFFQRFILATQFVFIPAVVVVGIMKAAAHAPFGWYLGILTIDIAFFFLVLFAVRVALLWGLKLNFLKRRVLVVGDSREARNVSDFVSMHGTSHLMLAGSLKEVYVGDEATVSRGNIALQAQPVQTAPLAQIAESLNADEIVVAVNDRRGLPVWQLLECKLKGLQVTDYLAFWERETGQVDLQVAGPGWLAFTSGFRLNASRLLIKRVVDVCVSILFLIAALPIGALVALAIQLDSRGPIFYKQERVGKDGKIFWIVKFRSMRVDAEHDGVPRWATMGDHRITRVGRLIRKMRLDEFPQVFNVLKGDMSFIGPRPERPYFVEQLRKQIPLYDLRHRVAPGVTGWAQVNHSYAASADDARGKLAYDLYYVKNQGLILDFVILLQTVRVLLFSHGAR